MTCDSREIHNRKQNRRPSEPLDFFFWQFRALCQDQGPKNEIPLKLGLTLVLFTKIEALSYNKVIRPHVIAVRAVQPVDSHQAHRLERYNFGKNLNTAMAWDSYVRASAHRKGHLCSLRLCRTVV